MNNVNLYKLNVKLIRNLAALVLLNINHALPSDQSDSDISSVNYTNSTLDMHISTRDREMIAYFIEHEKKSENGEHFFNKTIKGFLENKNLTYSDYLQHITRVSSDDEIEGTHPVTDANHEEHKAANRPSRKRKRPVIENDETITLKKRRGLEQKKTNAEIFEEKVINMFRNNPDVKSRKEAAPLLGYTLYSLEVTISKYKSYMDNPQILDRIDGRIRRANDRKERKLNVEKMIKDGIAKKEIVEKTGLSNGDVNRLISYLYKEGKLTTKQVGNANKSKNKSIAGKRSETYDKVNAFLRKRIADGTPHTSSWAELGRAFNQLPEEKRMYRELDARSIIPDHMRKLEKKPNFPDKQMLIDYIKKSRDHGSTRFGGKKSNSRSISHERQRASRKNTLNTMRKVRKIMRSMPKQKKKPSSRARINQTLKRNRS